MSQVATIIDNVQFFSDFNFKNEFAHTHKVEFIGNKARVYPSGLDMCSKPSRLNKLVEVGGWVGGKSPNLYGYMLIVNGQKVYMRVDYKYEK